MSSRLSRLKVVFGSLLLPIVAFIQIPALSLFLSPDAAGQAGYHLAIAGISSVILGVGTPASLTRAYFFHEQGPARAALLLRHANVRLLLLATATAAASTWTIGMAAISIGATLAVLQNRLAYEKAQFNGSGLILSIISLYVLPISVAFACAFASPPAVQGRMYLLGMAASGALLQVAWLLKRGRINGVRRERYNLRFSLPTVAHGAALVGLSAADRIFVSHLLGPSDLATYQLAYSLGSVTPPVLNAVNNIVAPTLYRAIADGEIYCLQRITRRFSLLAQASVMGNWILIALLSVFLRTDAYSISTVLTISLITTVSGVAYAGYLNSVHFFFIAGQSSKLLFSTPLAFTIGLSGSALLTAIAGLPGAAVGSVIGYFILWAATWRSAKSLQTGLPSPHRPIAASVTSGIAVAAALCLWVY